MGNEEKMAARLKEKRKELDLTMEELGNKVGVQKSAVNKWEKGLVSNMKRSTILSLSEIFGCSPTWLMGMDENIEKKADIAADIFLNDENITTMIDCFRKLNDSNKSEAIKYVKYLLVNQGEDI